MARITTTKDRLTVELAPSDKVWSLRGDVSVPRSAVTSVEVHDDALRQVHGVRAPGLGLPGVAKIGTWRRRGGKDLVVARRGRPAVVIELSGTPWRRLVVSCTDRPEAERVARAVRSAAD